MDNSIVSYNKEAEKLLMMFIKDGYNSTTGKISKKTAVAMCKYVATDQELQRLVNIGDWNSVINHSTNLKNKRGVNC